MVSSVFFLELLQEVFVGEVDTFRALSEVCEAVVVLPFSVDVFITSLLKQICFILPKFVSALGLAIAAEDARTILLKVIVVESFSSHGLVVAFRDFIVVWPVLLHRLLGQKVVEIVVTKTRPNNLADFSGRIAKFFVTTQTEEGENHKEDIHFDWSHESHVEAPEVPSYALLELHLAAHLSEIVYEYLFSLHFKFLL